MLRRGEIVKRKKYLRFSNTKYIENNKDGVSVMIWKIWWILTKLHIPTPQWDAAFQGEKQSKHMANKKMSCDCWTSNNSSVAVIEIMKFQNTIYYLYT